MNTITLLTWIAVYLTQATIVFNLLRSGMKFNLPSSLILSASISFLTLKISLNELPGCFFVDNIFAFIILGVLVVVIAAAPRPTD